MIQSIVVLILSSVFMTLHIQQLLCDWQSSQCKCKSGTSNIKVQANMRRLLPLATTCFALRSVRLGGYKGIYNIVWSLGAGLCTAFLLVIKLIVLTNTVNIVLRSSRNNLQGVSNLYGWLKIVFVMNVSVSLALPICMLIIRIITNLEWWGVWNLIWTLVLIIFWLVVLWFIYFHLHAIWNDRFVKMKCSKDDKNQNSKIKGLKRLRMVLWPFTLLVCIASPLLLYEIQRQFRNRDVSFEPETDQRLNVSSLLFTLIQAAFLAFAIWYAWKKKMKKQYSLSSYSSQSSVLKNRHVAQPNCKSVTIKKLVHYLMNDIKVKK